MGQKLKFVATLSLLLVACGPAETTEEVRPTSTLDAWLSPSPVASSTALATARQAAPSATPTPIQITHTVEANETMIGIAFRYGISLDALMMANPEVDPRFLRIGQTLVVPATDDPALAQSPALLELAPVELSEVRCYTGRSGSLTCLFTAKSKAENPVEGLEARVALLDAQGEELASRQVFGPLSTLLPGQTWPLEARFDDPIPDFEYAAAVLVTAIEVDAEEGPVLGLELDLDEPAHSVSGRLWWVGGQASLPSDAAVAVARIVILALAFDEQGRLVGYRKWESVSGITPGQSLSFKMAVFSHGPPIDRLELLSEAPEGEP